MNRPILDAIARFRSNRQDRVAARRGRIRDLLTPGQGPRKLLRSVGVGSARQDMAPYRKNLLMPQDRMQQDYPHGPDVGTSAGKRPYDGDGNPQGTTARLVSDNPAMSLPAPIQGGTNTLPAPKPLDPTRKYMADMERQRDQLLRFQGTPESQLLAQQSAMHTTSALAGMAADLQAREQDAERSTLAYQSREIQEAGRQAARSGQTEAFKAAVNTTPMYKTDKMGQPVSTPDYAALLRPHVNEYAAELISQHGNLSAVPTNQRASLLQSMVFSYPVPEFAQFQQKGQAPDPATSLAAVRRIADELTLFYNPAGDPAADRWYKALATQIVRHNGGRFEGDAVQNWVMGKTAEPQPTAPPWRPPSGGMGY